MQELEAGNGIPDLPLLVKKMRQQRKNMLQEKVRRTWKFEVEVFRWPPASDCCVSVTGPIDVTAAAFVVVFNRTRTLLHITSIFPWDSVSV